LTQNSLFLQTHITTPLIERALREDFGDVGDLTSQACIPEHQIMSGIIAARQEGVISGAQLAKNVFDAVDNQINVTLEKEDGAHVTKGTVIMHLKGPARSILMAERVALNFLGHMSGIASATNDLVQETQNTKAKIVCTRKTAPGLRAIQKYAVRCGGGYNHRFGLYDAVMIKDNHIDAAGGIARALQSIKNHVGHTVKIEIEVDTLAQLDEVLSEGTDIILLDNMSVDQLKEAVQRNNNQCLLEASGNVTVNTVKAIAKTGVDYISSGWITHSAPNFDFGLDTV